MSSYYWFSKNCGLLTPHAGRDGEHQDPSLPAGADAGWGSPVEDSVAVSYKTGRTLPCDPATTLLGIYSKELQTYTHTKTCAWGVKPRSS